MREAALSIYQEYLSDKVTIYIYDEVVRLCQGDFERRKTFQVYFPVRNYCQQVMFLDAQASLAVAPTPVPPSIRP